jgi:hypothetical protein
LICRRSWRTRLRPGDLPHGLAILGHGLTGAAVAAWPALALVGSYELLTMVLVAVALS